MVVLRDIVLMPHSLRQNYGVLAFDECAISDGQDILAMVSGIIKDCDDGSGNCPYQKSYARYEARRMEIQKQLIEQGVDKKSSAKRAIQQADSEIRVWHCRFCAQYGTGCCSGGDIRFNVVGKAHWEQAANKG